MKIYQIKYESANIFQNEIRFQILSLREKKEKSIMKYI